MLRHRWASDKPCAAGHDEVFERAELLVPVIDRRLQASHFAIGQGLIIRHRQLSAQIEETVLAGAQYLDEFGQLRPARLRFGEFGQQQPQLAVERVDLPHGLDARVIFRDAAAVGQSGLPSVAGTGVDLR